MDHLGYIRALVEQGGPRESDYAQLDAWISTIHSLIRSGQLSAAELITLREAFGEAFSPTTMQGFAFIKPHGYAGDFEIIDRIYKNYLSPLPHLTAWDRYWQSHAAAHAVRNRKDYFHQLLDRVAPPPGGGKSLSVLKLASGPGRSMFEWLSANPEAAISFECLEIDPKAIQYASCLNHRFRDRITFHQKNVLRYRPTAQYDLIWAAGLFDYFTDKVFASLVRRLLPALAPNGELVIGNFSDLNPSRPYMEIFDWLLNHRSPLDLRRIAEQCGVPHDRVTIGSEPAGVNLFLHISPNSTK